MASNPSRWCGDEWLLAARQPQRRRKQALGGTIANPCRRSRSCAMVDETRHRLA
jgi:hypothetical protein